MAKTVLTLEESDWEDDFSLIAISSASPSFQLAFKINQTLKLHLHRSRKDFDVQLKDKMAYFDIFEQENEGEDEFFYLIKNRTDRVVQEKKASAENTGLFGDMEPMQPVLIPNLKEADYFLKFKIQTISENEILRQLKTLVDTVWVKLIEEESIRSHNNLIFN